VLWQVWERVVRRPWTVIMPPGIRLQLTPHDPVTSGVLYCRLPDWPEMPFVRDYLRDGDLMVDVGANVGLYSLLAASVDGVQVVAFEPNDLARERAAANAAANGLAGRIDLRPLAVGRAAGAGRVTTGLGPENRLLGGAETTVLPEGAQAVQVVTLDECVAGPVALLKVDVEGGEADVLDGAHRVLSTARPVLILEANDLPALTARLVDLGYQWVRYDPHRRLLTPGAPPAPRQNGIAVADVDAVAARVARPSTA
jgi:FkbM family methyltransferase